MEKVFILGIIILNSLSSFDAQNVTSCQYGAVLADGSCADCGTTKYNPNIKIVGGTPAVAYSWPAQVLIVQSYKTNYYFNLAGTTLTISVRFKCGGTLINSRTVLTAAHCINKQFTYDYNGRTYTIPITTNSYYPSFESMFKAYLGAYDVSFVSTNSYPTSPTVQMPISKVVTHSSYSSATNLNDIALLILSSTVQTNDYIKYACLPKEQSNTIPTSDQACYASGWGTLSEGGSSPNTLYNVKLNIYGSSSCSAVLPSYPKNWNSQICAGDLSGSKDTCQGDSGGGLYIYDSTVGKYIVAGVTSYGEGCARPNKPGIYTRVSYYIDWIKANWQSSSNMHKLNISFILILIIATMFLID